MASKYTFLSSWANTFLGQLNSLKAIDDYVYKYRPGGPLSGRVSSRIYADTVKSQLSLIKKVATTSLTLTAEFTKNKIPESDYKSIVAGLDALIAKPDLAVSTNVQKIIDFVKTYLL